MASARGIDPASTLIPAPPETLCLDYANTLSWRGRERPSEGLGGVDDLARWLAGPAAWKTAVLPAIDAEILAQAILLREAMYRAFSALAAASPVADGDLAAINVALAGAARRRGLACVESRYAWCVDRPGASAWALLSPVLWSAADLMTRADHRRLRQCANPECLYLFVDESTAGTRRWCDMSSCGNRVKARRHYQRRKQA